VIVIDTNVLSETLRPGMRDAVVTAWLAAQFELAITSITAVELLTGVRMLPTGRRRQQLQSEIDALLATFDDSILPFDFGAATVLAELRESRRDAGRPLATEDGMIAAICLEWNYPLATRNVADFAGLGLTLLNPWHPADDQR